MKYALIFSSRYGQTQKIAQFIEKELRLHGHQVAVLHIQGWWRTPVLPPDIDAVVVGAPVYGGRFSSALMSWLRKNSVALGRLPLALFTVSLNAADLRPEARSADVALIRSWIEQSGLIPTHVASLAGALHYRRYNLFLRWVMRRISESAGGPIDVTRDHEMTDWSRVRVFAETLSHAPDTKGQTA